MTKIEKLDLKSKDIKKEQLEKLQLLFPEVITEGKVDFEKLKLTLGEDLEKSNERYNMTWAGKSGCFKIIQEPSIGTLKPVRKDSVDFDTTENLFIEGDNLEVLKLLQKSYYGKIKMIYIDPPYNTGNEFVYPDNYAENLQTYLQYTGQIDSNGKKFSTNTDTNGRYHSNWMNMMYPRLFLAKNLLKDEGVIFVSIDDHEVHNLKIIMNEIFGEENFVANIIWQHSIQPKGYTDKFSVHHNYALCYQKSNHFELQALERTDEHNKNYSNPDNDPKGLWRSGDVRNALYRPNLIFDINTPSGKVIKAPKNGWRWSKETLNQKINNGEIIFNEDETRIIRKIYLSNVDGRAPETIWFGKDVGTTRDASEELKELFENNSPFDTPKPSKIIKKIIKIATNPEDIILDFFAGSGTTAHAILELNKEDNGNRKFICVQLPESTDQNSEAFKAGYKNIAEISKERIRRVIKKIKEEQKTEQKKLTKDEKQDLGFKVFKLDISSFKIWDTKIQNVQTALTEHIEQIKESAKPEEILYEILLKDGFELTTKINKLKLTDKEVYSIEDNLLLICLDNNLSLNLFKEMKKLNPHRVIVLDKGFKDNDQLKTNSVQSLGKNTDDEFILRTV